MSITAKQYLIKSLMSELSRDVSAHDLEIIQCKLNDVLSMFEVESLPQGTPDSESSDLLQAFLTAKRIENKSEGTTELYTYYINRLMSAVNVPIHLLMTHINQIHQ